MCDFPSWVKKGKEILFLTDKDIPRGGDPYDYVGHNGLRTEFNLRHEDGTNKEGFPCPKEIARAIRDGKMRRLMKTGGPICTVTVNGHLKMKEWWYSPKRLNLRRRYKNSKEHGLSESYHRNGKPYTKQHYKDGRLHGWYEQWDQIGRRTAKKLWRNGKCIKTVL